jgi:hypothetical protein
MYSTSAKSLSKKISLHENNSQKLIAKLKNSLSERRYLSVQLNEAVTSVSISEDEIAKLTKKICDVKPHARPKEGDVICLPNGPFEPSPVEEMKCYLTAWRKTRNSALKRIEKIRDESRIAEICVRANETSLKTEREALCVFTRIAQEIEDRKVSTDEGIDLNVLKRALPQDVIQQIGEFLPCHIQLQLLEDKFNVPRCIYQLKLGATQAMYCKVVDHQELFNHLSCEHAEEITDLRVKIRLGRTNEILSEMQVSLLSALFLLKDNCPCLAYKLLREMQVLVECNKKYDTSRQVVRAM